MPGGWILKLFFWFITIYKCAIIQALVAFSEGFCQILQASDHLLTSFLLKFFAKFIIKLAIEIWGLHFGQTVITEQQECRPIFPWNLLNWYICHINQFLEILYFLALPNVDPHNFDLWPTLISRFNPLIHLFGSHLHRKLLMQRILAVKEMKDNPLRRRTTPNPLIVYLILNAKLQVIH